MPKIILDRAQQDRGITPKPKEVLAIFRVEGDLGIIDLYTIVLDSKVYQDYYNMLALGENVTSPQGFSQFTGGTYYASPVKDINKHLGIPIKWEDLPEGHRKHIVERLKEK